MFTANTEKYTYTDITMDIQSHKLQLGCMSSYKLENGSLLIVSNSS
jgi:hypothetical protein